MLITHPDGLENLQICCNTADEALKANIAHAVSLGLPEIAMVPGNTSHAVICGGGPSIAKYLKEIAEFKQAGVRIYALNNCAKYLCANGIRPDYQVVMDPRPEDAEFVKGDYSATLLLASQCHPDVFAAAAGREVKLWHAHLDGINEIIPKEALQVGGGITVGLSGICLAYTQGHSIFHLFGYDSSHEDGESHAYEQALNNGEQVLRVCVDSRVFTASLAMLAQARSFRRVAARLTELNCEITVYGDGLLPHIARMIEREGREKPLTAVYDLGVSPPTYDFLTFLTQAEKAREDGCYTVLDVVFSPGPMHGFRDDNLPPDAVERESMLHRICVPACRLVPAVRNVTVLREPAEVDGPVFPEGWTPELPIPHYGVRYQVNGHRCLRSTGAEHREIARRFPGRYATITLREADYWPARNSNREAWIKAAQWLNEMGIESVIVPDTHGEGLPCGTPFPQAAWDIDLRLALYERAEVNIGVATGPFVLCFLSDAPYLMFKPISTDAAPAHKESFLAAHGLRHGDTFSPNGRIVWDDDTPEAVIKGLHEWFYGQASEPEALALAANG